MRHLAENRSVNFTFNTSGGSHCIAAGMNWSPTDLDLIKYQNSRIPFDHLKLTWLSAIKKLNKKKEKAELLVFNQPSFYKYLKKEIYNG